MATKRPSKAKAKKTSQADYGPFFAATVTPTDLAANYRGNPAIQNLVNSCKGWAAICAHLRAEQAASYPIRLYGRADKGNSGRRLQGKRLVDLRNPAIAGKSAQYAESAGANVVEIPVDPALSLLHTPNPFQSGLEFFYAVYLYESACGNAFCEVVATGDAERPFQLLPLQSQWVSLLMNDDPEIPSLVKGYKYGRGQEQIEFAHDEVIHFKRAPSLFNPYWGASPLQGVLAESDLLEMATLNELANWQNGCSVNLAYEVSPDATEQQIKQLRSQFEGRHQGPGKSGRLFIGPGKLSSIDLKAREMEYREGQRYYSQMILSAFRVPESKVRLNDANLGSARTADVEFLSEAVRPMLVKMAETLTEEILYKRLGYERGSVWFAYDDIVPRDIAGLQAAAVGNVQNGIWTPDEARAEMGYGPLPNGEGAKLRAPVQLGATPAAPVIDGEKIPQAPQGPTADAQSAEIAEAVAAPPADLALNGAQIDSLLTIAEKVSLGQLPAAAAREILYAAFPTIAKERIEAIISGLEGFKPSPLGNDEAQPQAPEAPAPAPEAEPEGKSLGVLRWETVKGVEGKSLVNQKRAADGLLVMGGRILRAVDAEGKAVTPDALAQMAREVERWYASARADASIDARASELDGILRPYLEAVFQEGGKEGLSTLAGMAGGADLAAAVSFEQLPERALAFLKDYSIRLARKITETQQADLKSAIATAMEQGSNTQEATRLVNEALPDVARWKAEQIARTESTRAYTSGNLAAWREAGVKGKQWVLAPDSCPMCAAVADRFNKAHPLDEPFLKVGDEFTDATGTAHQISYADIDGPPLHPHDRCVVVPSLGDN